MLGARLARMFDPCNDHPAGRRCWHNGHVRLSRRSEYGLRALVDLIRHEGHGPISLGALAQRNNLPPKFLEQIMARLKAAGILRTTLGAHGGYAMAERPENVSVGRVIRLLDGALAPLPCVSLRYYGTCSCPDEATCALRDVMLDVRDSMLAILDRETLAQLAAREGRASIDPRGLHADALAGRRP
jgi:Rrf2 family protein